MPRGIAACDEATFVELFETKGPSYIAKLYKLDLRNVYDRRRSLEGKLKRQIMCPHGRSLTRVGAAHPARHALTVKNGCVLIGSDAHIWPGEPSTAMRGFIHMIRELKPSVVILNGDVLDFASISRHPPIGWESRPDVQDEIEAAQEILHMIERAMPRNAEKVWTLGNHDGRFETMIATRAPELAKVAGVHLQDHFPLWTPCWSVWINNDVVVKHRFKGGIHAAHNNAVSSGKTMVTGHLHSLKVTPWTDYTGTRFGVDSGCLADTNHKAFVDYTEDNPKNWRSGFVVLTFVNGRLVWPEVTAVVDLDHVEFRGRIIRV